MTESVTTKTSRGVTVGPTEVQTFIEHCIKTNLRLMEEGKESSNVVPCVWGPAGTAKTSLFKQLAKTGFEYKGKKIHPAVRHVALAQLEETGDLQGLPIEGKDSAGNDVTKYAAPEWWPRPEDSVDANGDFRPVLLLIDDFNRADPRILKAIMQLLQDNGTNSNQLPPGTTIGLTGNPPSDDDGTEYMVNEVDKAILTRMAHITMRFDKVAFALWAQQDGVDSRVINFALRYPELIDGTKGERTNPRSLVYFANLIKDMKDLKSEAVMTGILARSCLDDEVATTFEKFVIGDMQDIVEPEEILNNWPSAEKKFEKLKKRVSGKDGKEGKETKLRGDLMGIILDRLYVYLMQPSIIGTLGKPQFQGFLNLITREDLLPQDAVYTLLRRLRRDAKTKEQTQMFTDLIRFGGDKISKLILEIAS
jgi:hypothetical protein